MSLESLVENKMNKLLKVLGEILKELRRSKAPVGIFNYTTLGEVPKKGISTMFTIDGSTENNHRIKIVPTTASGKAASIEAGSLTVEVISGGGGFTKEDDSTVLLLSEDVDGATTYSVKGDADLGAGVQEISDTVVYNYKHPLAANLGITDDGEIPK